MGDVFFYHLTRRPLEAVLPQLLERARAADMRVAVRGVTQERMEWLDEKLWMEPKDGFLPHGLAGGPHDAAQPVLLTTGAAGNDPQCLMVVDGAEVTPQDVTAMARVCILFDGHDAAALGHARGQWKDLTEAGFAAKYWSEESGRWEMKAEKAGRPPG